MSVSKNMSEDKRDVTENVTQSGPGQISWTETDNLMNIYWGWEYGVYTSSIQVRMGCTIAHTVHLRGNQETTSEVILQETSTLSSEAVGFPDVGLAH